MMAANYQHIGGHENRLGRHYSRFRRFGHPQPLPINHLLCENRRTQGRMGEVGLTAGTVQAADKELRGATMGLHSMCGYAGGFIGPLGVGLVLEWAGSKDGWGLAFGHLALITLAGLFFLRRLGARSGVQTVVA